MSRRGAAPPWLEPLLTTTFFASCKVHADAARSECNMFCLDCSSSGGAAFCFYCRSSSHSDHRVIQVSPLPHISDILSRLSLSSLAFSLISLADFSSSVFISFSLYLSLLSASLSLLLSTSISFYLSLNSLSLSFFHDLFRIPCSSLFLLFLFLALPFSALSLCHFSFSQFLFLS